jgi:hypothetical protein
MEGASGKIYEYTQGKVIKVSKRKNNNFEYEIHLLAEELTKDFKVLRVPKVFQRISQKTYVMEEIEINPPKFETVGLLEELALFYKIMISKGYFPIDFELYQQSDNTIILLDFDKFGVITNNEIKICNKLIISWDNAFITPELSPEFSNQLKSLVFRKAIE